MRPVWNKNLAKKTSNRGRLKKLKEINRFRDSSGCVC